jgi:hypothetical protein
MSSLPNTQQLSAVNPAALAAITRGGGSAPNVIRATALKSKTDKEMQTERLRAAAASQDKSLRASALQSANQIAAVDARSAAQLAATQADAKARLAQQQAQFQTTTAATLAQNEATNERLLEDQRQRAEVQKLEESYAEKASQVRTGIEQLNNKIATASEEERVQLESQLVALEAREQEIHNELGVIHMYAQTTNRTVDETRELFARMKEYHETQISENSQIAAQAGGIISSRISDDVASDIQRAVETTGKGSFLGGFADFFLLTGDQTVDELGERSESAKKLLEEYGIQNVDNLSDEDIRTILKQRGIVSEGMAKTFAETHLKEGLIEGIAAQSEIDRAKVDAFVTPLIASMFDPEASGEDITELIESTAQNSGLNGSLIKEILVNLGDGLQQSGRLFREGSSEEGMMTERGETLLLQDPSQFGVANPLGGLTEFIFNTDFQGTPTASGFGALMGNMLQRVGEVISDRTRSGARELDQQRNFLKTIDMAEDVIYGRQKFDPADDTSDYFSQDEFERAIRIGTGLEEDSPLLGRLMSLIDKSEGNISSTRERLLEQEDLTDEQRSEIEDSDLLDLLALEKLRQQRLEQNISRDRSVYEREKDAFDSRSARSFLENDDLAELARLLGLETGRYDVGGGLTR